MNDIVLKVECEGVSIIKFWYNEEEKMYRGYACTSLVDGKKSVEIPQAARTTDIVLARACTYVSMFFKNNRHMTLTGPLAYDLYRAGSAHYLKKDMSDLEKDDWDKYVKFVMPEVIKLDHDEIGTW